MIYIVIPTRNRLGCLKKNITCIRGQTVQNSIIVINDGSDDGTKEWLDTQKDIHTIIGNGDLWWTGALRLGVEYVVLQAHDSDCILTMNDDCEFDSDYLNILLQCQKNIANSIMGSICFSGCDRKKVVNAGAMIRLDNNWGFGTKLELPENYQDKPPRPVDLLSGKGTLIPVKVFKKTGNFDQSLPHYGADYEFSHRAQKHGFQPHICYQAEVFNQLSDGGFNEKQIIKTWSDYQQVFFSTRSKRNVWYRLIYLSKTTPWWNVVRGIIVICIELCTNLIMIKKDR